MGLLWTIQNGYFDDVEVSKIVAASESLQEFLSTRKTDLMTKILIEKELTEKIEANLKTAIEEWKLTFS